MRPTLTIPDPGNHGQRKVSWGTWVKIFAACFTIIGAIISGVSIAGIVRLFEMSAQLQVVESWIIEEHAVDSEFRKKDAELEKEIDTLRKEDDRFLTLEQYYHDMGPEIRPRGRR